MRRAPRWQSLADLWPHLAARRATWPPLERVFARAPGPRSSLRSLPLRLDGPRGEPLRVTSRGWEQRGRPYAEIVAERELLRRPLLATERVVHVSGDVLDASPGNLRVVEVAA